ncbi:diguanylate cyclase domain-containing protein [Vogesella sp. GCM10023246]|uniref:GGDEF domain-containing protein n=1 Tax=Vogesella oryzagri TaxID=3160864 RepID=A0ABV1M7T9_9NEIS
MSCFVLPKRKAHQLRSPARANHLLYKQLAKLTVLLRKAQYLADHDPLTGLPNRRLLYDRLQQAMVMAAREQRQLAVLMIDVDQFKAVNDRHGHAAGDQLLQQVAQRLTHCLRSSDTACRLGGDEFVVILPELKGEDPAPRVVAKIQHALAQPYLLGQHALAISTSIGVALHHDRQQTADELLQQADSNMYRNKQAASATRAAQPQASLQS